jgi:hypothetical protein
MAINGAQVRKPGCRNQRKAFSLLVGIKRQRSDASVHVIFAKFFCDNSNALKMDFFVSPFLISHYYNYVTLHFIAHIVHVVKPSLFEGYGGFYSGLKRPGRDADHSSPSNIAIKNAWSYMV